MRVAIISDIHDNIPKLRSALAGLNDIDEIICLGDLCSPFIVKELSLGFSGPVHVVFGNNDGDRYRITEATNKYSNVRIHGEYVELAIGGKTFSVNHFDNVGRAIVASQTHDVVCFGHSHQYGVESVGRSLVVNPGEIFGLLTGKSTFVVYDTDTGQAQRVDVE
ncbi:MAG: metallophosphoesterase family protein [Candidatus Latescibacterota bacterium]|nr:MAG: metallophosphoesterase family protein [Candidatus Latescibacterota bacterium]